MKASSKLFAATIAAFVPVAACGAPVRVVDEDTLSIGDIFYRLNGIDAPEVGQICGDWRCGEAALERLAPLVPGQPVRCEAMHEDGLGRTIPTCFAGGTDIGAEMVSAGYPGA